MPQYIEVNGEVVEFPDNMSDDQIAQAIRGQSAESAPQRPPSIANVLAPKPRGVQPTSLGEYGRYLGGLGETALSMGTGLAAMPLAGLAGIGAMIPGGRSPAEAVEGVQSALTYQPRLEEGQQVAEGLSRPAQALDTGLTDVFDTGNPLLSAGLRTGAEALALAVPGSRAVKATKPAPGTFIPQVNDLFNVGRTAFNQARLKGGSISDDALRRAASSVDNITNDVGLKITFDPDVHGPAYAARRRILNDFEAGNVDFDNLMTLRELAGDVAGNADPAISMRGMRLKQSIDDFVNNLKPDDIMGAGNPEQAAEALNFARDIWRDAYAARTIERLIDKSDLAGKTNFTGAGKETALRQKFRALADRIIDGKEKGFTKAEIAAIRKVAEGTPIGNLFRQFGKASPTGIVSAAGGMGLGFALGGPVLGLGIGAGGLLGRHLATKATARNAQKALELPLKRSLLEP